MKISVIGLNANALFTFSMKNYLEIRVEEKICPRKIAGQ